MVQVAPSILSCDPMHMGRDIAMALESGADVLHVDIMDGHFVPNLTYGPGLVKGIKKAFPDAVQDVHLMMTEPEKYLDAFLSSGADEVTVHAEIAGDIPKMLQKIRAAGARAGLSVKPGTEVSAVIKYLPMLDLVLVMTVEPGFGGQKMIEKCADKVAALRRAGFAGLISCDGGVTKDNAGRLIALGCGRVVMGTAVFGAENPKEVISAVHAL